MLLCQRILFSTVSLAISVQFLALGNPSVVHAEWSDLRSFGDIMQIALPAAGLAGTFIADDPEGRYQWAWAVGGTAATTQVWKVAASKARPDAGARTSYPSGHTSAAFSGAAFIDSRYGHLWGVPAYAIAIITGYSRVDADAHFWDDVIAGASTGMLFNWYFTSPYSERYALLPAPMGDGIGLKLTVNYDADSSGERGEEPPLVIKYPNYTYIFRFGPAWQNKNFVQAPRDNGTPFNFTTYENIDEPITTSEIALDIRLAERHKFFIAFSPFENRDRTISTEAFNFNNQVFPSGAQIRSAYRLNEIRAQYSYGLFKGDRFNIFLGGGIAWQEVDIEILTDEGPDGPNVQSEIDESVFQPFLFLRGGYNVTEKIEAFLEMDGTSVDDNKIFNLFAGLNYSFNYHWHAGGGYVFSDRQIDTTDLRNEYEFEGVMVQIGYTF